MKHLCSCVFVGLAIAASGFVNAEDLTVFKDDSGKYLERSLKRQFDRCIELRQHAVEAITSRADCREWQRERRAFFLQQIGGLPERTPLNPRVVGTLEGDGYRIEKILFESRPNHHVTANLYLPVSDGPFPGVLIPCGHSHTGKAAGGYQRMSILLARNGMAALCYDPIGQGERYQSLDFEHEHETFASVSYRLEVPHPRVQFLCTVEHTMMGVGSILLGSNVAQYRIWDGMRAIDYLQSRNDIIADKIGCTGNSGGGTMTAYLMALDDRITAAVPICYLTTFQKLIETRGAQDGEQNIYGQISFGMDEADYVMMRAPKPTLIGAGARDATFAIDGTWELFRQSKQFYARLGFPLRVAMNDADLPHGMYLPQREAAARWLHRWLVGHDKAIHEIDPARLPDPISDKELRALSEGDWTKEQLYCTPDGQALLMPDEKSVFAINAEFEHALRKRRAETWSKLDDSGRRKLVRSIIAPLDVPANAELRRSFLAAEPSSSRTEHRETLLREGYRIEKLVLPASSHEIALPGLLFVPPNATKTPVMYLHGTGMTVDAEAGGPIEQLVRDGHVVLAAELSGIGETETGHDKRDYGRGRFGRDVQEIYLAYLLGQSFVGVRTRDVLRWSDVLADYGSAQDAADSHPIEMFAIGEAAIPALHAAALEPNRFQKVHLHRMLRSWADLVASTENLDQLVNTVHGALEHYDLPHLVELAGSSRVKIVEPVNAIGKVLSP